METTTVRRSSRKAASLTPAATSPIAKTRSVGLDLSPWSQAAHATLSAAGKADAFIHPSESGELDPSVSKQTRQLRKKYRKQNTRTEIKKIAAAQPPPPPPPPTQVVAKYKPPTQDSRNRPPRHQTRSTPQCWHTPDADPRVGRHVLWLSTANGRSTHRAKIVEAREDGQCKIEGADGAAEWWDIGQLFAGKRMKYEFVGCGCPGVIDGLCRRDLESHRPWGSTAELTVHSFAGLDSVLVEAGKGQGSQPIVSEALLQKVAAGVRSELNVSIVKLRGQYGGEQGVFKSEMNYKSPLCNNYGCCSECGVSTIEAKEVATSRLSRYSSTHQAPSPGTTWNSIGHVPPDMATVGRIVFRKLFNLLSPATQKCRGFDSYQSRIYRHGQFTRLHTDTRVELDDEGNPTRKICQVKMRASNSCLPTKRTPTAVLFMCAETQHRRRHLDDWRHDDLLAEVLPVSRS